ncbi:MAG: hypothetical protein ACRERC_06800 [Candidatus Binatia bacterium]
MFQHHALRVAITLLLAPPAFAASAEDRFAVAGIAEAEARSMFKALQDAVRSDDHEKVAELVEYPLRIDGSPTHKFISDRSQLLSEFARVFTKQVRRQVLEERFDDLFVNWRGVMVGSGAIWFSGICDPESPGGTCRNARVRVIAVNLNTES